MTYKLFKLFITRYYLRIVRVAFEIRIRFYFHLLFQYIKKSLYERNCLQIFNFSVSNEFRSKLVIK